jgi:endonuclease YncB( thermonuclease family)
MSFLPTTCQAVITRIIDGDTYVAEFNAKEYVVRIIGVDCFETRYSAKLRQQARKHGIPLSVAYLKGVAAKNFAESVLLAETVTLTRPNDSPDNDIHFRHLRTVTVLWGNVQTDFAQLLKQRQHVA